MGPKKTSRHSKRVWQPSAWSFEPYDVENCHAIVHSKKVNMSRLEYARLFGATIKERVKRTASWASYYNTSRKSRHPRPDTKLSLDNVPLMIPLPAVNLPSNDCDILRNWTLMLRLSIRFSSKTKDSVEKCYGHHCNIYGSPLSLY